MLTRHISTIVQKPQISSNVTFLYVATLSLFRFSFPSLTCHNMTPVLCLGLGTKTRIRKT